jgi:hypothetical protein|tara:strand:+ start:472 stop:666 length:195 start_codon:yes stop_codon:yes gene_type:complete
MKIEGAMDFLEREMRSLKMNFQDTITYIEKNGCESAEVWKSYEVYKENMYYCKEYIAKRLGEKI